MEVEIGGRTSPFEFVEPVCIYGNADDTPNTVHNTACRLTFDEVAELLVNTDEDRCTCWPPSKAQDGDVFVFTYQEEKHHFDFVADGMNWRNQGTRLYSKAGLVIKKRYYQRRIGKDVVAFRKCVYEMSTLRRVLIHYMGPRDEDLPEAPHGNRKKQLDKGHIRVMPSVLADIKESRDGIGEIYMKMVADCKVPSQNLKVAMPRNMKQVENRKQYEKKQEVVEKCDVGEVFTLLRLNTELGGFIKYLSIVPSLNAVLINEHLLREWVEVASSGERCLLSYVTRLKFRDFYISLLVAQHSQFESEPGIPIAYLIHHRNTSTCYSLLLREVLQQAPCFNAENIILVTEKDKSIREACTDILKHAQHFYSWDSLKKSTNHQLRKQKITGQQKKSCLEDVSNLLLCNSEGDYNSLYESLHPTWSEEFKVFYDIQLFDEIKTSILGKLVLHGVYDNIHGIATVESVGVGIVFNKLSTWNEPSLEGVALALYMVGSYYQCEIARSFGVAGMWRLKEEFSGRAQEAQDLKLPADASGPAEIVSFVRNKLSATEDSSKW